MKLIDRLKPEFRLVLEQDTNYPHHCEEISEALEKYEYVIHIPYGVIVSMNFLFGNLSSPFNYFYEL